MPLPQVIDQRPEVGIASAEAARQKVAAALGDAFTVGEHLEFADLPGPLHGIDVQSLFDQGHEPRDLLGVVGSSRAMNDFNLHGLSL